MQQYTAVPYSLVKTTYNFQKSATRRQWHQRKMASPGSISEISFRLINLRAALKCGEITDPAVIRSRALELDHDLEMWRISLPKSWKYVPVRVSDEASAGLCLNGQSHKYTSNWIADAWNNWRSVRILTKQIIFENEMRLPVPDPAQLSSAISVIQEVSAGICISTYSFRDSPRKFWADLDVVRHES